jgi:hypothetical protein
MFEPDPAITRLFAGITIGIALGLFIAVFLAPITSFCDLPGHETAAKCARDWISALSGWAAFAAGAGAAYVAYKTIGPMRGQLQEMKRQTDFAVGDADPEFVILRNKKLNNLYMRVTNYNRRNIVIESFGLVGEDDIAISGAVENIEDGPSRVIFPPYTMEGWRARDREAPTRRFSFRLVTTSGAGVSPNDLMYLEMSVAISYRVVGQDHIPKTAISTALPLFD